MELSMVFFLRSVLKRFFILGSIFIVSCQKNISAFDQQCPSSPIISGSIIIGTNDWKDYQSVGDSNQNSNELTVAQLKIPAINASCNGFLINENILMTNNHCISSSADSKDAKAIFRNSDGGRTSFLCDKFIYTNSQLDFTLLGCQGEPGKKFGYVNLSSVKSEINDEVYVVEENCDYIKDPYCTIYKYVSYGHVLGSIELKTSYDLDTLPGSSGSPVFSGKTQNVIAIHHAGAIATSTESPLNEGVPMNKILLDIKNKTNILVNEKSHGSLPIVTHTNSSGACVP